MTSMKKYARIEAGVVVEFTETDQDIGELFHPSLTWVECSGAIEIGWTFDGVSFASPPPPPPPAKGDLIAYAANARWRKEIGGVTFAGVAIATDDRSKQMILGARVAASADPAFVTNWVSADGSIVPLDATNIVALSNVVLGHVDGCFSTYAAVVAEINDGSIATIAEVDAAFA